MPLFQIICIAVAFIVVDLGSVTGAPLIAREEASDVVDTIYYHLFTRKNPTEYQTLQLDNIDALKKSNYNPNAKVKFYAPGWGNDGSIVYPAKDEHLIREDCNVVIIDWRTAQKPNYTDGIKSTTETGLHTSAFIDFLIENGTPRSAFHLIGHSAGTHLAGVASAGVSSGRLPRVTGLDPARSWPLNDTDNRLDITDADFVDIVHTNGGTNPDNRAIFNAIGHVDFYANGGRYQPGCQDDHCNHLRATDLFTESINSKLGFKSLRCDTFEHFQQGLCDDNEVEFMGDPTPTSARGVFQFATNGISPFARE